MLSRSFKSWLLRACDIRIGGKRLCVISAFLILFVGALVSVSQPVFAETKATKKKVQQTKATSKNKTAKASLKPSGSSKSQAADTKPVAAPKSQEPKSNLASSLGVKSNSGQKSPLYIKSKSLNLDSKARVFTYQGDVQVVRDDLLITADAMTGEYDQQNQIQTVTCEGNVVVTRADNLRATSNRAVYHVATSKIEMTENPELSHNGNDLSADKVILYVDEDRSEAEGNVRVKVAKADGKGMALSDLEKKGVDKDQAAKLVDDTKQSGANGRASTKGADQ